MMLLISSMGKLKVPNYHMYFFSGDLAYFFYNDSFLCFFRSILLIQTLDINMLGQRFSVRNLGPFVLN